MAAVAFTLTRVGKPEIVGTEKVVRWTLDCTNYNSTSDINPTVKQLGLNRLTSLEVYPRENRWLPKWNGSLATPLIEVVGQGADGTAAGVFTEAGTDVDVGEFLVVARGR